MSSNISQSKVKNKVRVTFESICPIKSSRVGDIPTVRVGVILNAYEGYVLAYLCQHVGKHVTADKIQPGDWFAIPTDIKTTIGTVIINTCPPGGTLDYVKSTVKKHCRRMLQCKYLLNRKM